MPLQRFLIERDIPKAGSLDSRQLKEAAIKSNEVLRQLGSDIQWVESYIADDKLYASIWQQARSSSASTRRSAGLWRRRSSRSAA
jgi:hypothetical protein